MKIIIVGAGISGLSLGWFLKKRFGERLNLSILEAAERPGGWIRSDNSQGFLFEEGPRSCRSRGAGTTTLQLIEELGLCHQLISASSAAKQRFIYWDGKLQQIPSSFLSFLFSSLTKGVLPVLWKEWQTPPGNMEDESIADFMERRLNKEIADKFMDPLVSGIYAGDIHRLSMRSCFPEMHLKEQNFGSLLKGFLKKKRAKEDLSAFVEAQKTTPIFTFKHGMETLVTSLAEKMKEHIRLSCCVESVHTENESVEVCTSEGQILQADRVYLAIPAQAAAKIVNHFCEEAMDDMSQQICATVAVVNMGWNEKVLKHEGFGYLVPSNQHLKILGVVFDSSAFPEQNRHESETRLTVMLGGMNHPEIERFSHEKIAEIAQVAIKSHLAIHVDPAAMKVSIAKQAIPQYEVGHQKRLQRIESQLHKRSNSRVFLLGSAWRGVAVNDCITEAKQIAAMGDFYV